MGSHSSARPFSLESWATKSLKKCLRAAPHLQCWHSSLCPVAEAKKGGEYIHYHKLHRGTIRMGMLKKEMKPLLMSRPKRIEYMCTEGSFSTTYKRKNLWGSGWCQIISYASCVSRVWQKPLENRACILCKLRITISGDLDSFTKLETFLQKYSRCLMMYQVFSI